jgi:hypothetical protein
MLPEWQRKTPWWALPAFCFCFCFLFLLRYSIEGRKERWTAYLIRAHTHAHLFVCMCTHVCWACCGCMRVIHAWIGKREIFLNIRQSVKHLSKGSLTVPMCIKRTCVCVCACLCVHACGKREIFLNVRFLVEHIPKESCRVLMREYRTRTSAYVYMLDSSGMW